MKVFLVGLVLIVTASGAASAKANTSGLNDGAIQQSGSRITVRNESLKGIVFFAFGIPWGRDYALSGPDWPDSEKFDVVATYPPGTSGDRVQEMLQTLLSDRFGLKTHSENRKLESYVLLVGKRGPEAAGGHYGRGRSVHMGGRPGDMPSDFHGRACEQAFRSSV
jgi:uncharacterized protein (TIGR03435 family)